MDYCDLFNITENLNVLFVEDDTLLCDETVELLQDFFASVHACYDGEEGLHTYKEFHQNNRKYFDLIITDINMPILNGLDMSRHILSINPKQIIVILTALNDPSYTHELNTLGINYVIKKPITTQQTLNVLYEAAHQHINNN